MSPTEKATAVLNQLLAEISGKQDSPAIRAGVAVAIHSWATTVVSELLSPAHMVEGCLTPYQKSCCPFFGGEGYCYRYRREVQPSDLEPCGRPSWCVAGAVLVVIGEKK